MACVATISTNSRIWHASLEGMATKSTFSATAVPPLMYSQIFLRHRFSVAFLLHQLAPQEGGSHE